MTNNEKESINNRKSSRLKSDVQRQFSKSKLNGAQFIAAASAGNFNFSSASNIILANGKIDMKKLCLTIDQLNKTLHQHAALFKKMTDSIEKLNAKVDSVIKSSNINISSSENVNSKVLAHNIQPAFNSETSHPPKVILSNLNETLEGAISNSHQELEFLNNKLEQLQKKTTAIENAVTNETPTRLITFQFENASTSKSNLVDKSITPINSPQKDQENSNSLSKHSVSINVLNERTNKKAKVESYQHQTDDLSNLSKNSFQENANYEKERNTGDEEEEEDDEEDDDDEEDGDDGHSDTKSKKKPKTSPYHAVLNKSKIETSILNSLLDSLGKTKQDRRFDANEINKLRLLSHSYQNFAVKLLVRLFDEKEIVGRNVYGRNYSGDRSLMKLPLDPDRIEFIKRTVLYLTKTTNPEMAWASCVIAMNRKLVDINNKYLQKNSKS